MKKQRLTVHEQRLYDALKSNPKGLSYEALLDIKPSAPQRKIDLVRTHMKVLRQKTGLEIENVRGWGYKIVQ